MKGKVNSIIMTSISSLLLQMS